MENNNLFPKEEDDVEITKENENQVFEFPFSPNEVRIITQNNSIQVIMALKQDFIKAMSCAYQIFEKDAFRKRIKKDDTRYPINKAIFDSLSVGLAKQPQLAIQTLIRKKEIFKNKFIELNNDKDFWYAISTSTGQKSSVEKRFKEIQRIIKETIEDND